jgi:hypothetical protein
MAPAGPPRRCVQRFARTSNAERRCALMAEPAPFDFHALSDLLARAALARRLSMTTTDEQATETLGQLAEELDVQIDFLTREMVRGDW